MISLQVLQAFLSNDASQRQAAEAHFQNMDVNARVLEWPAVYQQAISGNDTNRNNNNNINNNTAMLHMIAVLWRRDILQCGGGGGGANNSSLVTLMDPLLQIFAASALDDDKIRAAFGHCLAEVVALTESSAALEQALKPTEALVGFVSSVVRSSFDYCSHNRVLLHLLILIIVCIQNLKYDSFLDQDPSGARLGALPILGPSRLAASVDAVRDGLGAGPAAGHPRS